ncbi:Dipeptidyl peptidase III [Phaffia rhodozyma]|uniref:Dipeptidyl peptidase 3 n=1 Tax=Phaffia rhodozyma TaxID=264483 RepID=A0A0F7SMM2_PHARH|nr:Dipeptidyl peptidase III [Phaffia rhodozyma]
MSKAETVVNPYLADPAPPVCGLEITSAFNNLTKKEQLYSHWQSKAGWEGARIIMAQMSHDVKDIIDLLLYILSKPNPKAGRQGEPDNILVDLPNVFKQAGFNEEEQQQFLSYASQVFGNLGNFKSFGHTQFIPRLTQEKFARIVATAIHHKASPLWEKIKVAIYSIKRKSQLTIGKPSSGHTSGYYLPRKTTYDDTDSDYLQTVLEKHEISQLNTRVEKTEDGKLIVWIASVEEEEREIEDGKVIIKKGDFKREMEAISLALEQAKKYAANDAQKGFIDDYVKSFRTGLIEDHVKGSEKWVKDIGPVVETYIGFVETYVDPYGGRAEWEAFTAIVDKELSAKYATLVDSAPELIKALPWGTEYEVDNFIKPDFTSLQIVSFATGGIPAGINIPNYFSVRDKVGFKNVSLGNISAAKDPNEKLTFLTEDDVVLYKEFESQAWELQVALHELLGHGSGKLFQESPDGTVNFDRATINPLTGKPVESWYKPGQTPDSVLGTCSSSYEECRAEAVALYLATNEDILKLFKYTDKKSQEGVLFTMYLMMVRAGLRALEFFNPELKKHGQAHMQARIGITNVLIQDGIVSLIETRNEDGKLTDATIKLNREKVLKEGSNSMGRLLVELQVRKCTADGKGARSFYEQLTTPIENWDGELRDLVISKKAPRKLFCQPNTFIVDGEVILKEYPLTLEGLIESTIERGI